MYIAYLGHSNTQKNKLEIEFHKYLKSIDRTIVENKDVINLQKEILKKYDDLCAEFSRCKPVEKSFWDRYSEAEDFSLHGANCVFTLLKSK